MSDEPKLEIYKKFSILTDGNGKKTTFLEGRQSAQAKKRYHIITQKLDGGYLDVLYLNVTPQMDITESQLPEEYRTLLFQITSNVTSEVGRAILVLTIIQLTIKSIDNSQNIRLHKGNVSSSFSWNEGISMRTIDSNFVTPFLRKQNLLKLNKYGAFMTRSLAENYPYTPLYKASIRGGSKEDWQKIVDAIEDKKIHSKYALMYVLGLLKNRSDEFKKIADKAHSLSERFIKERDFTSIEDLIIDIVNSSDYKARIFEVSMHSLMQALQEGKLLDGTLSPMTQMRSANKKHINVGDIEIRQNGVLHEAWDAKYGKEYLRDELDELDDKLANFQSIESVGFVTDKSPLLDNEIKSRIQDISEMHNVSLRVLSFKDWVALKLRGVSHDLLANLGHNWLLYFVDSLGQKRRNIAPIDEPSEEWLKTIIKIIETKLNSES